MLYCLIARGVATPVELRTTWTVEDVLDANEALDWYDYLERKAKREAEKS